MFLHSAPRFKIYFGGVEDQLSKPYYLNLPDQPLLGLEPFNQLTQSLPIKQLLFLHQIHSNQGMAINSQQLMHVKPFKQDGDFLTTNLPYVGIGIMSADCLPIIFYDNIHNVIASAHAGWKGSAIGVGVKTIEKMQEIYGTQPADLTVFFGPSVKVCCCKVSADFKNHFEGFVYKEFAFNTVENHLHFDLPLFNRMQLEAAGVKKESIHLEYNACTMCNSSFYSHRRDPHNEKRQMTVVSLN